MYLALNDNESENEMIEPQVRYPAQFPAGEITNVISYLRGTDNVDLACAAECAWNVQGFAMSFIPHAHPPIVGETAEDCPPDDCKGKQDCSDCTNEELAAKLEECKTACETGPVNADAGIPAWLILLAPVIREVVNRLLDKLG